VPGTLHSGRAIHEEALLLKALLPASVAQGESDKATAHRCTGASPLAILRGLRRDVYASPLEPRIPLFEYM
jgi:hypothetical protein